MMAVAGFALKCAGRLPGDAAGRALPRLGRLLKSSAYDVAVMDTALPVADTLNLLPGLVHRGQLALSALALKPPHS